MPSLIKGGAPVSMTKTPMVKAVVSWPASTDYDLYAIVLYQDGTTETVAMFDADGVRAQATLTRLPGAVQHMGDVGRVGAATTAEEVVEIRLTDDIRAVVPVVYSAQSNGSGSFRRYAVSMTVDNGIPAETVHVSAPNASANNAVYTCAVAVVENTSDGVVIHSLETYSAPGSEKRPLVELASKGWGKSKRAYVRVTMDDGPLNTYK